MISDKQKKENKAFLWRQFIKLGDMMGDGLHNEPDGKWISDEYESLARQLIPNYNAKKRERNRRMRQEKNKKIDQLISEKIKVDKCQCDGQLIQVRSGSMKVKWTKCGQRYAYKKKK